MKKYKTKTTKYESLEETTCDWCGRQVETENKFDMNEFEFIYKVGTRDYDGGGEVDKIELDFCFSCRELLIKLLEQNNVTIKRDNYTF